MADDLSSAQTVPGSPQTSPVTWRQLVAAPIVGLVLGGVAVVLLAVAWMIVFMGRTGGANVQSAAAGLSGNFFMNIAIVAALYLPLILTLWIAMKKLAPPPGVRFFSELKPVTMLLALGTGVLAAGACILIEELLNRYLGISFEMTPAEQSFYPTTAAQLAGAVVVMGFIGPLAEEMYFRGFLLQWLRQHLGTGAAIVLSAVAFAVVHLFMLLHPGASGWVTTGEIFVVGILMALWVTRTGSLWSSYALHIGYNCVVVMQTFLFPS